MLVLRHKRIERKPMSDVLDRIGAVRLVPVVVIENAEDAVPLGEALMEGGLPCAEVTFRTEAAAEAIRKLSTIKGLLLGAGTVVTVDQAKAAVDSGVEFIVTPGFNPEVVGYCVENSIPITPGICTPTGIEAAMSFGLTTVKFFPAEAFGGLNTLKAISAPYGAVKFVPTGGINATNVVDYLAFPKVLACGGSWMVKKDLISAGNFGEITRLTRAAVAAAKSV